MGTFHFHPIKHVSRYFDNCNKGECPLCRCFIGLITETHLYMTLPLTMSFDLTECTIQLLDLSNAAHWAVAPWHSSLAAYKNLSLRPIRYRVPKTLPAITCCLRRTRVKAASCFAVTATLWNTSPTDKLHFLNRIDAYSIQPVPMVNQGALLSSRPVQSTNIPVSLGSTQPRCNWYPKTTRTQTSTIVYWCS